MPFVGILITMYKTEKYIKIIKKRSVNADEFLCMDLIWDF